MSQWRTILSFEGMTWGDLRELVRLADVRGIDDSENVILDVSDATDQIVGIQIEGR